MKMYAYIGLFESFARLVIAFLLAIGNCDKLILFSALSATVSILTLISYILYDRISFQECRISWIWQSNLVKEMLRFIGYTMFGCLAWSVSNQGMNIVLNIFFGPAINAARAIALQVSATIDRFSSSLITAAAPQIIKSYAEKDINYMTSIIEKVSKFSFFWRAPWLCLSYGKPNTFCTSGWDKYPIIQLSSPVCWLSTRSSTSFPTSLYCGQCYGTHQKHPDIWKVHHPCGTAHWLHCPFLLCQSIIGHIRHHCDRFGVLWLLSY